MVGVAYKATILEVRADVDGGLDGRCASKPSDIALGLDYASPRRPASSSCPVQGRRPMGERFEAALERATRAGWWW
jgi:hypothetical protein